MSKEPILSALELDDPSWKILFDAVRRLESAWRNGSVEDLSEFVASVPDTIRVPVLTELIKVDQECAWKRGDRRLSEAYLASWPELSACEGACLELIEAECLMRAVLGDPATTDEIRVRFPGLADRIDLNGIRRQAQEEADGKRVALEMLSSNYQLTGRLEPTLLGDGGTNAILANELAGERVGDYELLNELGRGGMGVVYRARQTNSDRIVAIKVMMSGRLASPDDIQRFRRETAAARISHPNIVPLIQVGDDNGLHYYSMEYVAGLSLQEQLRDELLAPRDAAQLVRTIAGAVQHAHEKRILHRDLKPTNVLIERHGTPYLTDFGLAKRTESESQLTATGAIVGTPNYMAPEQIDPKLGDVGPESDVYGLGGILYYCLTGRPPFLAGSSLETLQQVLRDEPKSTREFNSKIPKELDVICLYCLRKAPRERYASAADLAADLKQFLNGGPILARPVNPARRFVMWCRRHPVMTVTVALLSVLCAVLLAASLKIDSTRSQEKAARLYAEDVFDWSADSLGRLENTFRHHRDFVDDERYRDLQTELLSISKDHYRSIARLKVDDPSRFPFLESKRGNAHWWLGVVDFWDAFSVTDRPAKRTAFENALEQFEEMQTIYRQLLSANPDDPELQFRYGWSCGWKATVLNELERDNEVRVECEQAIEVLADCPHPHAPVKLGACYLELALMAARGKDVDGAKRYIEIAVTSLDSSPPTDDPFIERDRLYFRTERVEKVVHSLAESGSYQAASLLLRKLAAEFPDEPKQLYFTSIADLGFGDLPEYLKTRKELLTRFGKADPPTDRIAYAYAPIPLEEKAVEERAALAEVATKLPDPRSRAAILYRLNRYDEALSCLTERNDGRAWDHFLFAFCHTRLGNMEQARNSYRAAVNWIDDAQSSNESVGWAESIETTAFILEAKRMGLSQQKH